jgi:IS4 transposase
MSKERAIEICMHLTATITKMKEKIIRNSDNEMFKVPSASTAELKRKRQEIIKKFKLLPEEYGITKNKG